MEPGMEIREEHKRELQQREEHERALKQYKERKGGSGRKHPGLLLVLLIALALFAVIRITVLLVLLSEEKKESARMEAYLAEWRREQEENPKRYTQEMVDELISGGRSGKNCVLHWRNRGQV